MPRNYKSESEWARQRYKQIKFNVPHEVAASLQAHLAAHGIKPIEWFKHAVFCNLKPPGHSDVTGTSGHVAEDAAATGTGTNADLNHGPAAEGSGGYSEADVEVCETALFEAGGPGAGQPKIRKAAMPSPAPGLVAEWSRLHREGMTFTRIAKESGGYETSTVRKRVRKHDSGNAD